MSGSPGTADDPKERINAALRSDDPELAQAASYAVGTSVIEAGEFPPSWFDSLLEAMPGDLFLKSENSWLLLRMFEENWSDVTETQRTRLLPVLEKIFPRLEDWRAGFVIASLLGELYADERALETLVRLRATKDDKRRSLVPHGLQHIASDCSDERVGRRAREELLRMRADRSATVRTEVAESLSRLGTSHSSKQ